MPPIVVKSQLSFKTYLNINFYLLLRKRYMLIIVLIILLIVLWVLFSGDGANNYYTALGVLIFYLLILPVTTYLASVRNYKKIRSMGELKTYSFDEESITVSSETINFNSKWSPVERIRERKDDFLLVTSNGRAVHYLPKNGFDNETAMSAFKDLVRSKGIKGIK